MEKRFFLAILLSITVFLLWNQFFAPPPPETPTVTPTNQDVTSSLPVSNTDLSAQSSDPTMLIDNPVDAVEPHETIPPAERRTIKIETPRVLAELDTLGARITSWKLKEYEGVENQPIELISPDDPLHYPGSVRINGLDAFNDTVFASSFDGKSIVLNDENPKTQITFTAMLRTGERVQKDLTFFHDKYLVNMALSLTNQSSANIGSTVEYLLPDKLIEPLGGQATNRYIRSGPVFWTGYAREKPKINKIQTRQTYPGIRWAAFQESYFFTAVLSASQLAVGFVEPDRLQPEPGKTPTIVSGLKLESKMLAPGDTVQQHIMLLIGPKKYDELQKLGIGIENIVDFGWITILGKFFYYFLTKSVLYVKNFGFGIILITLIVKLLLFPLSHKQMQSMKKMQAIQPQMKAIQEKYRKDPQKQQQELSQLYKKHGVNPMGGCLPLLIQFPVFIALYQVLMNLVEMRGASFFWVKDLAQPNVIMVLIMGVSMLIQQKMTPVSGDPRQAKMMMMMPVIFTAMFWNFPSGLVLYWLTNNILTIGQQYVMNRLQAKNEDKGPKMKSRVKRKIDDKNKNDDK
ncbi:MAG: membrane protein insertase YidC [bacterium]